MRISSISPALRSDRTPATVRYCLPASVRKRPAPRRTMRTCPFWPKAFRQYKAARRVFRPMRGRHASRLPHLEAELAATLTVAKLASRTNALIPRPRQSILSQSISLRVGSAYETRKIVMELFGGSDGVRQKKVSVPRSGKDVPGALKEKRECSPQERPCRRRHRE